MDYSQIIYEVSDHIATVTLNRPDNLNAFTTTMCAEMLDAFDRIDADDNVRAVIVTGASITFSTHPSPADRIAELEKVVPATLEQYARQPQVDGRFRQAVGVK